MNKAFYSDLELIRKDSEQLKAFNSQKSTVVIAGPGSGKTRVLTLKAMKLLNSVIHAPSGLACVSYSRETVRELKKRLDLYNYKRSSKDFIGTVHSFCLSEIIAPFSRLYPEYQIQEPISIISNVEVNRIYKIVLAKLGISKDDLPLISIERERYTSIVGSSTVVLEANALASEGAKYFEDELRKIGGLDFTMVAKVATQIIQEKQYARECIEARFPWMLIDEYQDLGKALHEMVLTLQATTDIKIFAVGDMDQSIYGFQGAYPDFLKEIYSNDEFTSVKLKYNYRSNQEMISASLATLNLPPPGNKYEARLKKDESAEFYFITCSEGMDEQWSTVAQKVIPKLTEQGIPLNEIAVLVGKNEEAANLANVLMDSHIPCFIVKWPFERSDVVCWLEECVLWYSEPRKVSFGGLVNFWIRLLETHDSPDSLLPKIELQCRFLEVLEDARSKEKLSDWIDEIITKLALTDLLATSTRYPDEYANLEKLLQDAQSGSMKNFETSRLGKLGKPENELTITTRHSAKGLEFEVIILLGMDENIFPDYRTLASRDSRKIEEVNRLCYVCVSRAKRACYLLRSRFYTIPTKNGPWKKAHSPSRFWKSLHEKFGTEENSFRSDEFF